jgi:hypothetical protein
MASLERLAWRPRGNDFAIIGQYIDREMQMENMLGASMLPLTVLVGPDGRVLKKIYGAREWDGADALQLIDASFHRRK